MLHPQQLENELDRSIRKDEQARSVTQRRTDMSFIEWMHEYITLRGQLFSFEGHEYLREPYQDDHPDQSYQKAAQVGISSRCLYEALYLAEQFSVKALYYLSTDDDAEDFSNDRINIAIDDSAYLKSLVGMRERGRDNVGLRHVVDGSLYCRGMYTRRKVKSIDGDVLYFDELDEADQENKQFALDRILHSSWQYKRELSQPSLPNYGINESFQRTDQRYYHILCSACGAWACMDLNLEERDGMLYPKHILPVPANASWVKPHQQYYRACLKCERPLDMSNGSWVAQYPSIVTRRGYHISQLYRDLPKKPYADPADWIMYELSSARKTIEKTRVMNSILGMPYEGDRAPVTDAVLDACEGEDAFHEKGHGSVLGIDQGDQLHLVVGRGLQVIHAEHTDDWGRIPYLISRFGVVCAVGDALPNKQSMKERIRAASIPFYLQYFTGSTMVEGEEGEGSRAVRKVTVDRTESLDETTQGLRDGTIRLPNMQRLTGEKLRAYELFRAQCKMLAKDLVESAKGVLHWEYKKQVPNHFGMALNSMRIAHEIYRGVRVDFDLLASSGVKTTAAKMTAESVLGDDEEIPGLRRESETTRKTAGVLSEFAY